MTFDPLDFGDIRNLADGHYFSPDGGDFEVAGGRWYWNDGSITDPILVRVMKQPQGERYSLWTDEQRGEAKAEIDRRTYNSRRERVLEKRKILRLHRRAKKKLTAEELEAVELYGLYAGCYWP